MNLSFTDPTSESSQQCDSSYRSTLSISWVSNVRTCYNLWAIYSQVQTRNADNVIARDNNTLKAYYKLPGLFQISIPVNNTQNFANITSNTTQVRFFRSLDYDPRRINLYDTEDCTENGFPSTTNSSQWLGCSNTQIPCSTVPISVRSFSVEANGTEFDGMTECTESFENQLKNTASHFAVNNSQNGFFVLALWAFLHFLR